MPQQKYDLHLGDCLVVLKTLENNSIDSCVTDPPYHLQSIVSRFSKTNVNDKNKTGKRAKTRADGYARLAVGFMGQQWDGGDIAFKKEVWQQVFRVLKPGAHLVAFGGTRTYHRMACAIEDAGFEIRDQIGWLYGTGFPKSHNVGQAIQKLKTTGKARRPDRNLGGLPRNRFSDSVEGTLIANTGGKVPITNDIAKQWESWGTALKPAWEPIVLARKPLGKKTVAENVLEYGTGVINIEESRVALGNDFKNIPTSRPSLTGLPSNYNKDNANKQDTRGRFPANIIHDGSQEVIDKFPNTGIRAGGRIGNAGGGTVTNIPIGTFEPGNLGFGNSGSTSRFFYSSKISKKDRGPDNNHPTVKPTDLMRYLCVLITPPGGTILDPFMGSGSTGRGALLAEFKFIGIEKKKEYFEIAKKRIAECDKMTLEDFFK